MCKKENSVNNMGNLTKKIYTHTHITSSPPAYFHHFYQNSRQICWFSLLWHCSMQWPFFQNQHLCVFIITVLLENPRLYFMLTKSSLFQDILDSWTIVYIDDLEKVISTVTRNIPDLRNTVIYVLNPHL